MELTEDRGPAPKRRSRLALWGTLAVVALVAGVGAVLAANGSDGDAAGPPLPITLSGPAGGEGSEAQSLGAPEVDSDASMDMSIAPGWLTYVAGDGLPALGGTGTAYRLVGDVDEARVAALAAAVGLEGTPEQISEVDGWRVEEPGVGLLEAYPWGGGTFWFNLTSGSDGVVSSSGSGVAVAEERKAAEESGGGVSGSPGSSGSDPGCADGEECELPPEVVECMEELEATGSGEPCAGAPDGGTYCVETGTEERCWPCDEVVNCGDGAPAPDPDVEPVPVPETVPTDPVPPADLPTQEEAEQIARDLYAAAGGTFEIVEVVADGPYEAWYVTLKLGIDGQPVMGLEWNVGVGPDGVVQSAGGSLGRAEPLGSYDLLDTAAAIDRLNEQMGGFAEPMPMPAEDAPAVDVAEEPAGPPEADGGCIPTEDGGVWCEPECGTTPDGGEYCEGFEGEPVADPPSDCEPKCGSEPSDGTVPTCKPQPDGSEICETEPGPGGAPGCDTPEATTVPPDDPDAPVSSDCDDTVVDPIPEPVPVEPQEVVLTGAEPILLTMPSWDGVDNYIVPAYRFTGDDGVEAVVHAVLDEAIESIQPPTVETIVPG